MNPCVMNMDEMGQTEIKTVEMIEMVIHETVNNGNAGNIVLTYSCVRSVFESTR